MTVTGAFPFPDPRRYESELTPDIAVQFMAAAESHAELGLTSDVVEQTKLFPDRALAKNVLRYLGGMTSEQQYFDEADAVDSDEQDLTDAGKIALSTFFKVDDEPHSVAASEPVVQLVGSNETTGEPTEEDDKKQEAQQAEEQFPFFSLRQLTTTTFARLQDKVTGTHSNLASGGTQSLLEDLHRLQTVQHDPGQLSSEIINRRFVTGAGMEAAKVWQDAVRLHNSSQDPTQLLNDIINRRFFTGEGMEAAKAQQDAARLEQFSQDPAQLLNDIINRRFVTGEGLRGASTQQDRIRLSLAYQDPSSLLSDIINRRFLTADGELNAKIRQDEARLEQSESASEIRSDLSNRRYVTAEGIRQAEEKLHSLR